MAVIVAQVSPEWTGYATIGVFFVLPATCYVIAKIMEGFRDKRRRRDLEEYQRLAATPGTAEYDERQTTIRRQEEERQQREAAAEERRRKIAAAGITSWRGAEHAMARAMTEMGFENIRVSKNGADSGVDIKATRAVAQVKYFAAGGKVGRPAIQQLRGIAGPKTDGLFFAFGTKPYTKEAFTWASRYGIALFVYDRMGVVRPVNYTADGIVARHHGGKTIETPASALETAPRVSKRS